MKYEEFDVTSHSFGIQRFPNGSFLKREDPFFFFSAPKIQPTRHLLYVDHCGDVLIRDSEQSGEKYLDFIRLED